MDKIEHKGFTSYLETGEFTEEFFSDLEYWAKKMFYKWTLFTPFEDFLSNVWERLLERIPNFDPNIATFQTLVLSTINNECWRIYMKNKIRLSHPEDDIDDPAVNYGLGKETDETFIVQLITDMSLLGIKCDYEQLKTEYYSDSIVGKCLMWKRLKNEGRIVSI